MSTAYFPSSSGSSNVRGILTYTVSSTATQTTVNLSAVLQVKGVYGSGYKCDVKVNGSSVFSPIPQGHRDPPAPTDWTQFLSTGNYSKTYNRTDADQPLTVVASFSGISDQGWSPGAGSGSVTVTLTIPKLEQPTVTQALGSKTGSTATITWSSNMAIDHVWYSSNNGSSWTDAGAVNSSSGSYTITGLAANTSYNIKTRVRGKASQLTSDSSALSVTTYAAPTISQSLASKTDTTIKISWTSGSTCDYLWYSTNGGSSWTAIGSINASSGTYTISGLSADTSYSIKTRVRGKDSQLTKDSSALSVTTYGYPTISQSVSSKTASSITIAWSSNSICDYLWYSINGGSSWSGIDITDGTSGNYTISGLSADTSYNIITRVRRKDSQYTRDSSALSVTTYGYPTVSQLAADVTETTITIWWESNSVCDYVWYSTNGGSSWSAVGSANAKSGSFTISGLSANTSYSVNTRLRRKDSQLTANGTAFSIKTYDYPRPTSMPNFTIGNSLKVTIYNPLKRTVTVTFIAADGSTKSAGTVSGITVEGFNSSAWTAFLYASIPSAKSGNYKIKVTYGSVNNQANGGTYSINQADCTPVINALSYRDTNSTTIAITGNNQKIIQSQSIVQYTASGVSTLNSATIASIKVSVNGDEYTLTESAGSATGGNAAIDSGTNVTATVTLTDSRGLKATKSVTVTMLPWSLPSAYIMLKRASNFYNETTLNVDAVYSPLNNNNTITITYSGSPDLRGHGPEETIPGSVSGNLYDNTPIQLNLDNNFDWNFTITLTDKFGTKTYYRKLSRGMPIIFFDDQLNAVGIGKFPEYERGLAVAGRTDFFDHIFLDTYQKTLHYKDASNRDVNFYHSIVRRADSVNRLTTIGWYRVFECNFASADNSLGYHPQFVELTVRLSSGSTNTDLHRITLAVSRGNIEFINEMSDAYHAYIDKIRYNTDGNGKGFIDVHLNQEITNGLYSSTDLIARPYIYLWYPIDYQSVAEAPTGETTQAIYSFMIKGYNFGMDVHFNNHTYLGNDDLSILMPRYSESSQQLSSAGWYRVCKIVFSSASQSNGAGGILLDVILASSYNNTNNNIHKVSLLASYLYFSFVNETSKNYSTDTITKVRYTTDGNGNGYIDLYYAVNVGNVVNATVSFNSIKGIAGYESMGFASVASAPSGETVRAEYTFKSNYNEYDDRYYKAGDSVTISPRLIVAGIVQASSKELTFEIVLPKKIDNISSISVTACSGAVYGINGAIDSSSTTKDWMSGYTVGALKRIGNLILLDIQKSSAMSGATTNTPCMFYTNGISLTFS